MNYPKGVIKSKKEMGVVAFDEKDLVDIDIDPRALKVEMRTGGSFALKGYFLDHEDYDWQIVTDDAGVLILVPTKRSV